MALVKKEELFPWLPCHDGCPRERIPRVAAININHPKDWLAEITGLGGTSGIKRDFAKGWERKLHELQPDAFHEAHVVGERQYLYVDVGGRIYDMTRDHWFRELESRFYELHDYVDMRTSAERQAEADKELAGIRGGSPRVKGRSREED
jgi:hypothetical protein